MALIEGKSCKMMLGGIEIKGVSSWSISNYDGLSVDAKPAGVQAGSIFHEHDSGATYTYDGTIWVEMITEGGDDVNMRKAIEHTRMRFDKMTERQLWNRMGATTTRNKIEAFAIVAEEKGMLSTAAAARARLEELYGVISHGSTKAQKTVLKKSNGGKLLRRMDTA